MHLRAVRRSVGPLRPEDGPPVAPGHQEEPLADGGGSVVRRHQLPPLYVVAQRGQLSHKLLEGLPHPGLDGLPSPHRPPGLELLHVLQDDDPGANCPGPSQGDPGEAPDLLVHGLPALGLGKVLAVRGGPQQPHRPAAAHLPGIDVPHAGLVVLRVGVVGLVHQDGVRVVVDGDSHRTPAGQLDPRGRSSAPGKVVHDDLIIHAQLRT